MVPTEDLNSMLISLSTRYQPFNQQLLARGTAGSPEIPIPAPSVPPSLQPIPTASAMSTAYVEMYVQERMCNLDWIERNHPQHTFAESVEEDDLDTVSLGSDTEWRAGNLHLIYNLNFHQIGLIWIFFLLDRRSSRQLECCPRIGVDNEA